MLSVRLRRAMLANTRSRIPQKTDLPALGRASEARKHTDGEFLARLHHVDSNGQLEVVFLEAKPFLERGELRHGRRIVLIVQCRRSNASE